jgi:hypothetical protein
MRDGSPGCSQATDDIACRLSLHRASTHPVSAIGSRNRVKVKVRVAGSVALQSKSKAGPNVSSRRAVLDWLRSLVGRLRDDRVDPAIRVRALATLPVLRFPAQFAVLKAEILHAILPVSGLDAGERKILGPGQLFLTNRRIVFRGKRKLALSRRSLDSTGLGEDGRTILVYMRNEDCYQFEAPDRRTAAVAAEILHILGDPDWR